MDFKKVLSFLLSDFQKEGIRYALIGGFAMGALGIVRATMDLDFLVDRSDAESLDHVLKDHGYSLFYQSENVAQYQSDLKPFGSVDVLYAFRPVSLSMLKRAESLPVFGGEYHIPVLLPEDIIGLKVQALSNTDERKAIDIADITLILQQYSRSVDWGQLSDYFLLFEQEELFEQFKQRFKPES